MAEVPTPMRDRIKQLEKILNTPVTEDFWEGLKSEAAHQTYHRSRQDEEKEPQDWFWVIGYLAGKALAAHLAGDKEKALHHTISTAAVLSHWHEAIQNEEKQ